MTAHTRSRWWTVLVAAVLAAAGALTGSPASIAFADGPATSQTDPATRPAAAAERRNGALSPAAHAQISAAIGEDDPDYHVRSHSGGVQVRNPRHRVSADFSAAGVEFALAASRWSLTVRGHGYGDRLQSADRSTPTTAAANRVEYRRDTVTEWYVNGPLGIEQGFTFAAPPGRSNGEPLTVALAIKGNLTPSVAGGGRALALTNGGVTVLRYAALSSWDANGRELPAWLEVDGRELRIRVDDAGAQYPLTIDPYVQAPALNTAKPCDQSGVCDDGGPYTQFGYAVSISADASTVVVGAPGKYFNNTYIQRGVAYVFVKPPDYEGGWNGGWGPNYFKTKLLAAENLTTYLTFGVSVDISRDGGTVVVGGRGVGGYVYLRPASGWGSFATQTQNARLTAVPRSNETNYFIGSSVAISGDGATIAVGAPGLEIDSVRRGATYVFLRPATGWVSAFETQRITGIAGSEYGHATTLSDDAKVLVVSAPGNPEATLPVAGAAHVLARRSNSGSPDSYAAVAKLIPSSPVYDDRFAWSVSADGTGDTVVVGSYQTPTATAFGAAFVYVRPSRGWGVPSFTTAETAMLLASDSVSLNTGLGYAVDISRDGRTIVAGSGPGAGEPVGQTAAYFYAKPAAGWSTRTESAKVVPSDALQEDWFGTAVTLSGDGSVVVGGAFGKEVDANLMRGVAYVFTGSATAAKAVVSPSSLTFAPQSIATTSNPKTVTMTNTGTAPLHVTNVNVIGQFTTTQHCVSASPIAPGGSCSESVASAPSYLGPNVGTLSFVDDSNGVIGAVQSVSLQGEGTPVNTITRIESITAAHLLVNQQVAVFFEVRAEAGSTYTPAGPVVVQASTGESCGASVMAGYCTLAFATAGNRTITATFAGNNQVNSSTSAPVRVQVVDFSLAASPASQVTTTKKATFTVTITPVSGSNATLPLTCTGGPANATCSFNPSSVSLVGGPTTAKATVTLPNNAPVGTYTITFTGTFGAGARSTTATLTVNKSAARAGSE